jgi:serine phosphatase RsbU (regulator of sigma subunit)
MLYTFSDGYPDQFGGPDGKKFMIKNFRTKLKEIKDKPLSEQKVILDVTIEKWMGDQSQIDDILVVGIRV